MREVNKETFKNLLLFAGIPAIIICGVLMTARIGPGGRVEVTLTPTFGSPSESDQRASVTPIPTPGSELTPTPSNTNGDWCTEFGYMWEYRPPVVVDGVEVAPAGYICVSGAYFAPAQP